MATNAVPKSMTLDEIRTATAGDPTLREVMKAVQTGRWDKPGVEGFARFAAEISVTDGIVLRGHRIIVPHQLRVRVINIAHQSHQGMVRTKQCIRVEVWFPGIDSAVEEMVKSCIPCQASNPRSSSREPIQATPLPPEPWMCLSMDFAGPFQSGDYLLVVIDEYSRYPEVEIISSTAASSVIPKLDNVFARQGFPTVVKTDNGPPFKGQEFAQFAEACGFKHRKVTPLHPEANGEAERFMRTVNQAIRAAVAEGKNWKTVLPAFLRLYRATPHAATKISPFEALTGRKMKYGLPNLQPKTSLSRQPQNIHTHLFQNDEKAKLKMATYADARRHTQASSLKPGDQVLVRQKKITKLTPPFSPSPYEVVKKNGSMVTARRGDHEVVRNSSHFKPVRGATRLHASASDAEEEQEPPEQQPQQPQQPQQQLVPSQASPPRPAPADTTRSPAAARHPDGPRPATAGPMPVRHKYSTRSTKGYAPQMPSRYRD